MSADAKSVGDVTFSVENFGPIAKAEFDLRPLTVFVGPTNTGKSYLAMLIYALCRHCTVNRGVLPVSGPGRRDEFARLSAGEKDAFSEWATEYQRAQPEMSGNVPALPGPVVEAVRRFFSEPTGTYWGIDDSLRQCFGIRDIEGLIRRGAAHPARVEVSVPDASAHVGISIGRDTGLVSVSASIPPPVEIRSPRLWLLDESLRSHVSDMDRETAPEIPQRVTGLAYETIIRHAFAEALPSLVRPAHYLPANRTGIVNTASVLVDALIDRGTVAASDLHSDAPGPSRVITDLLRKLRKPGMGEGGLAKLSKELEDSILRGSIHEDRTSKADFPIFSYHPKGAGGGKGIPLFNASSAVSELAPIVLFLRNHVQTGDLLIVEGPEAHLHPAMQVQLAVLLAKLVRAGVRVVVTTHSAWILEQFANLVGISMIGDSARTEYESNHPDIADAWIPGQHIGVWLFSPDETSGAVLNEVKHDEESGLFPANFDDVSADLYNRWAEIYSMIEEAKGNDRT